MHTEAQHKLDDKQVVVFLFMQNGKRRLKESIRTASVKLN